MRKKIIFALQHHWRQPRPVRSFIAELLGRSGLHRFITFKYNGYRLHLRSGGLAPLLWANPHRSLDGEPFFKSFLRSGDTVVDVGANIGTHALTAAHIVGDSGRVIAVEAHPETFAALGANIALNRLKNVTAYCVAVGADNGVVELSNRRDDDWNQVSMSGGIAVAQQTLDHLCAGLSRITLLKLDVEGYELPCLRGARVVLSRTDCVLLEYWHEHARKFGYGLAELLAFLRSDGFFGLLLDEQDGIVTTSAVDIETCEGRLVNLVFVRDRAQLHGRDGMLRNGSA